MSQRRVLYQWTAMVRNHLAGLSLPQVKSLAAFSLGLGLAQRCALGAVSGKLSMLGRGETVERRLRRFISNPNLELAGCCQMLSRWVLGSLKSRGPLVLLVDETSLQEHLKVMVVAVAYRGKALPLAWRCYYQGNGPMYLAGADPEFAAVGGPGVYLRGRRCWPKRTVVSANSPQLLQAIEAMGWCYLVRVTKGVRLILAEGEEVGFQSVVTQVDQHLDQSWRGEVQAFKKAGWLSCRALAKWGQVHEEPWLLLTNYPAARPEWYGTRMWEESGLQRPEVQRLAIAAENGSGHRNEPSDCGPNPPKRRGDAGKTGNDGGGDAMVQVWSQ